MLDVRFLRNPFYEAELKALTGLDQKAADYIAADPGFTDYYEKMVEWLEVFLTDYLPKRDADMVIAIGCTGGQHRSVYVAQKLGDFLQQQGYPVSVSHRDIP